MTTKGEGACVVGCGKDLAGILSGWRREDTGAAWEEKSLPTLDVNWIQKDRFFCGDDDEWQERPDHCIPLTILCGDCMRELGLIW